MSFILDALKKSETDRQRQSGPALFEVRVAPPRNGLPLWAVGLAVLLAVNLVIVAWVLLRRPATPEVTAGTPASPEQQRSMATNQTAPAGQGYVQQGSSPAPAGSPGQQQTAPAPNAVPVSGVAPTAPIGQSAGMTQAPMTSGGATPGAPLPANVGNGSSDALAAQAADAAAAEKVNPDDYAPAADPGPAPPFGNHVTRGTSSGVPLYQDAALAPGAHIPQLRLDLHVFASKPQERFVMINMKKLHEGDSLPEGVHVDAITPEGALLSHDGTRFLLPRD